MYPKTTTGQNKKMSPKLFTDDVINDFIWWAPCTLNDFAIYGSKLAK